MVKNRIVMNEEDKNLLSNPSLMPHEILVRAHKFYPKNFVSSQGYDP
jgi:hypothetical protein